MGANYAEAAFHEWAHLPGNAFKALVRMALIPHDYKPNPTYWQGWELLALEALNCTDWRYKDEPDRTRLRRAAERKVERAVQELVAAGAITRRRRGYAGRNAEYRLNLTTVKKLRYLDGARE